MCYLGLQDLEVAEREGDAARWSLRDSKEAQVQALRAQSAAFDQTLDDVQTAAAQVLPVSPCHLLSRLAVAVQTPASASILPYAEFQFCLVS